MSARQTWATTWTPAATQARIDALRGDLDETLALVVAIVEAGAWRPWMPKALMRVHRGDVTRLMRRLGPLIPKQPPKTWPATMTSSSTTLPEPLSGDVPSSLAAARRWMDDGRWRPWMVHALLQLHRGEEAALMRHLGPMIGLRKRQQQRQQTSSTTPQPKRRPQPGASVVTLAQQTPPAIDPTSLPWAA